MPLKLDPPRKGKSPYWYVRGTHLGVFVNRSAKTASKSVANEIRKQWEREIEGGQFVSRTDLNFADAVKAYVKAGGEKRFLRPLLDHFETTAIKSIDQAAVDEAAAALYPQAAAATLNRQVYTPMAAILRRADPEHAIRLRRPKEKGGQRTNWIEPEQFGRLLANAGDLAPLLTFLVYTGCRIGEALQLDWARVNLAESMAYIATTKNDEPRAVHLPEPVVLALANLSAREGRVFGIRHRWYVYKPWRAMTAAAGLPWVTPHVCCHTYATWMRRYGKVDLRGLLGTGRWKDIKSVLRYTHVVTSDESRKSDLLPVPKLEKRRKRKAK